MYSRCLCGFLHVHRLLPRSSFHRSLEPSLPLNLLGVSRSEAFQSGFSSASSPVVLIFFLFLIWSLSPFLHSFACILQHSPSPCLFLVHDCNPMRKSSIHYLSSASSSPSLLVAMTTITVTGYTKTTGAACGSSRVEGLQVYSG